MPQISLSVAPLTGAELARKRATPLESYWMSPTSIRLPWIVSPSPYETPFSSVTVTLTSFVIVPLASTVSSGFGSPSMITVVSQ